MNFIESERMTELIADVMRKGAALKASKNSGNGEMSAQKEAAAEAHYAITRLKRYVLESVLDEQRQLLEWIRSAIKVLVGEGATATENLRVIEHGQAIIKKNDERSQIVSRNIEQFDIIQIVNPRTDAYMSLMIVQALQERQVEAFLISPGQVALIGIESKELGRDEPNFIRVGRARVAPHVDGLLLSKPGSPFLV